MRSISVFRSANGQDVEVRPSWFLLVDTKRKRPRHGLIPMNEPVRPALQKVIDRRTTGKRLDYKQTGVSASTLRSGFEKACEQAGIPFELTVEGGVVSHDLGRTFATELRGRQVHEYDIAEHHLSPIFTFGAEVILRAKLMEDVNTVGLIVVPRAGVEPARPFGQRILSPQRLPFRHPGMLSVSLNITRISVSLKHLYPDVNTSMSQR